MVHLLHRLYGVVAPDLVYWQSCEQERGCVVHFLRLLAVCWPCAQSLLLNYVLACDSAKYLPILFFSLTDLVINLS